MKRRQNYALFVSIWLIVTAISLFFLDAPVARFVRNSGAEAWIERDRGLREFLKTPGEPQALVLATMAALILHRHKWRAVVFMIAAVGVSAISSVMKWLIGRHRPFTWRYDVTEDMRTFAFLPLRDGWVGFTDVRNLSFPSGHAALAFALATSLAMLWPRLSVAFYVLATVTAVERVWENAHYVSEVLAAAGLGVLIVHGVAGLFGIRVNQTSAPAQDLSAAAPDRAKGIAPREGIYLSLVIPAYNEQENIPALLDRVGAALSQIQKPFEVLVVDDGSTDSTPHLLEEALTRLPWLRVLRMQRNSGQSAAFEVGFEAARGEIIATIDADLQNDPEEIPRLLPLLDEKNVDMITGWRKERQDTPFRRWQSRQANRIRNWISQETVNDSASSLKIYRAHAIKGLKLFNGAHRFFPTLVKMRGFTCYETPVKHSQRFAGTAKYGFGNRAVRAFVDLLAVRWMKERHLRYRAVETKR